MRTGVREEDTLCVEDSSKVIVSCWLPEHPPAPSSSCPRCLPCSPSQLPAEKVEEGVGNADALLSSSPSNQNCSPACPALPARVRRSQSPGAGRGTIPSLPLLILCPTAAPHIRVQLLARSLCISPSFPRSGLPDS